MPWMCSGNTRTNIKIIYFRYLFLRNIALSPFSLFEACVNCVWCFIFFQFKALACEHQNVQNTIKSFVKQQAQRRDFNYFSVSAIRYNFPLDLFRFWFKIFCPRDSKSANHCFNSSRQKSNEKIKREFTQRKFVSEYWCLFARPFFLQLHKCFFAAWLASFEAHFMTKNPSLRWCLTNNREETAEKKRNLHQDAILQRSRDSSNIVKPSVGWMLFKFHKLLINLDKLIFKVSIVLWTTSS